MINLPEEVTKSFLQYKADNIDHASMTLDGYGSVHVMGQVTIFTPAIKIIRHITRLKVDLEIVSIWWITKNLSNQFNEMK